MSDLSRLLDDVYEQPAAKDDAKGWTSDEALDSAFSDWVPGPGEDASETEKSLFAGAKARPTDNADSITDKPTGGFRPESLATQTPSVDPVRSEPPVHRTGSDGVTDAVTPTAPTEVPHPVVSRSAHEWGSSNPSPTEIAPVPVAWRPEDDDILPSRPQHRFLGLTIRR